MVCRIGGSGGVALVGRGRNGLVGGHSFSFFFFFFSFHFIIFFFFPPLFVFISFLSFLFLPP
jgi:hypothetical protein